MRRIRILDEAAKEAIEAAAWYEHKHAGLGARFSQAVDAALDLLEDDIIPLTAMPGTASSRGAKRLALKRFPYDIVVRLHSGYCRRCSRASLSAPGYWRGRLRP